MAKEEDMTKVLLALTLSVLLSSVAGAEDPVEFGDPRLKAAVENELWISDPTPTDMLGLTTLNARWEGISDLTGLGYATNLQILRINNNEISDISVVATLHNLTVLDFHDNHVSDISVVSGLTYLSELVIRGNNVTDLSPVAGLTGLQFLYASFNQISDISPLAGLTNLLYLNLEGNQISNLSPLSGLDDLHTLVLRDNQIGDISPLTGPTGMRNLDLHGNHISDISPLAGAVTLRRLDLSRNQVSDISPLAGLSNLSFLILSENQIHDISALSGFTSLDHLDLRDNPLNQEAYDVYLPLITVNNPGLWLAHDGGSSVRRLSVSSTAGGWVIAPGEGTFTYDSGAIVLLEARADPQFVFSHWSGTYSTSQNPVPITMTRDHQMQANFQRVQALIYVDDDAHADPGPGDADLSDPQENGTSEHPFDGIQEAIETVADGASIIVRPGTYFENIDFLGKPIQLLGIDIGDPDEVSFPVLDGAGVGPVVTFAGGEDPNCVLRGFVITGGYGTPAGAIYCHGSSPTVMNCLIVGNRATGLNAATLYCFHSNAVFANCTIADNDSRPLGAGVCLIGSNVTFVNSILWGNTAGQILLDSRSEPLISYCDIAGGWPGEGNIDADPLFVQRGYWASSRNPDVVVEPDDPEAIWIDGDYHLQSEAGRWDGEKQIWVRDLATSPCIDAGDPKSPVGDEPSPNGSIINIGAYGGTAETGKSHFNF